MYDLARDIVEMVCKMLTVVDAVSQNPALTQHKLGPLNNAKDALYTVTRAFAESVRMLTHPATMSEEEERAALQRAATNALKAGAECVSAIKLALTRMPRQQALHVQSPERGAMMHLSPLDAKRTALTPVPTIVTNSSALNALYASQGVDDDQDLTIQAQTPAGTPMPPRLLGRTLSPLSPLSPTPNDLRAPSAFLQTPTESIGKPLPPIRPRVSLEERPQSPTLSTRTDDGTTWEGSLRGHSPTTTLEQKLMDGDLPAVPEGEMTAEGLAQNWMVSNDYAVDDVAYNSEGHLVGATLPALVEKLTPHDGLTDSGFATVFFTTFRLFATPQELLEAIIARYNILPPPGLPEEYLPEWQHGKGLRVRLRVANLLKTWLDAHWRVSTDAAVLPSIYGFTRDAIAGMWPGPAQQLLALVASRQQSTSDAPLSPRLIALPPPPSAGEMPRPIITKTLFAALRSHSWSTITVADFDTLELARQFTVLEYGLFVVIGADEVLDMGERDGAGGGRSPPSVRAVTGFSTAVTGWVSECVLNEPDTKKRMGLVKYFIKLADVSGQARPTSW
jgi:son of sevenless-like protein